MVKGNGPCPTPSKTVRPSNHCAVDIELKPDMVAPRISGNIPQINSNKKPGWANDTLISNEYTTAIKVKSHSCENKRQKNFKDFTFKLDMFLG